jgi:type IV secretory pathway VirB3-like protein
MKPYLFFSLQAVLCMYLVYCDICHNDLSVKSLLRAWYYTSINFLKTGCWFANVISLFSQATFTCVILYKYQLFKDGLLISKISHDLSIVHLFLWYYSSLVFCLVFSISLFLLSSVFLWSLHCISFHLLLLITPLISSNCSKIRKYGSSEIIPKK